MGKTGRLRRAGSFGVPFGLAGVISLVPVIIVFMALVPGTADAQDVLRRDPARHTLSTFINKHVEYGCRNSYVTERTGSTNIRGQVNEISIQAPNTLVAHKSGAEDLEIEAEECDVVVIGDEAGLCSRPEDSGTLPAGEFDFRIDFEDVDGDRCAQIIEQ